MTLSRQYTLTKSGDFSYVFDSAKKVYGQYTTLLYRPSKQPQPRLGLIVSKKHTKTAIKRNLVRRIAKESFKASNVGQFDVIILSKPAIATVDKKILRLAIDKQWQTMIKRCASSS